MGFPFIDSGSDGNLERSPMSENKFDFMKEWIFFPLDIQKELQKAIEE